MSKKTKKQAKTNTVTRFFNKIEVFQGEWLKKTSTYSSKFLDEINWFLNLPENLINYVPAIKSINNKKEPYSITYKYLTSPTLHTQLCFGQPQNKFWKYVKKQYKAVLANCKENKPEEFDEEYWTRNLTDMYIKKTIDRLEDAKKNKDLAYWFDNNFITINDERYPSASTILKFFKDALANNFEDLIYKDLKKIVTPTKNTICFMHGDMVFSNVFVYKTGKDYYFKCIDPRGSFGADKNYGDLIYDYAKIYQSVFGLYDFILENNYECLFNGQHIKYWIHKNPEIKACQRAFKRNFIPMGLLQKVKIVEALQFLSMVPLHNDRPDHQKIFLSHGIVRLCDAATKIWK